MLARRRCGWTVGKPGLHNVQATSSHLKYSRRRKGDKKQFPSWGPINIRHPDDPETRICASLPYAKLSLIFYIFVTAIGLSPGGSSTVHIYTQTVHRTTQNKQYIEQHNNLGECGPCPVLARFTLAFALQLRKKQWSLFMHFVTALLTKIETRSIK